jgi:hypothetical protein
MSDLKLPRGVKLAQPEEDFTVLTIAAPVEEIVETEAPETVDVPAEAGSPEDAARAEDEEAGDK